MKIEKDIILLLKERNIPETHDNKERISMLINACDRFLKDINKDNGNKNILITKLANQSSIICEGIKY